MRGCGQDPRGPLRLGPCGQGTRERAAGLWFGASAWPSSAWSSARGLTVSWAPELPVGLGVGAFPGVLRESWGPP